MYLFSFTSLGTITIVIVTAISVYIVYRWRQRRRQHQAGYGGLENQIGKCVRVCIYYIMSFFLFFLVQMDVISHDVGVQADPSPDIRRDSTGAWDNAG